MSRRLNFSKVHLRFFYYLRCKTDRIHKPPIYDCTQSKWRMLSEYDDVDLLYCAVAYHVAVVLDFLALRRVSASTSLSNRRCIRATQSIDMHKWPILI